MGFDAKDQSDYREERLGNVETWDRRTKAGFIWIVHEHWCEQLCEGLEAQRHLARGYGPFVRGWIPGDVCAYRGYVYNRGVAYTGYHYYFLYHSSPFSILDDIGRALVQ